MSDIVTHWHIKTTHMDGTPDYPSKEAVYIYLTGCARNLLSTNQDNFKLIKFENMVDEVTCKLCHAWAKAYIRNNKPEEPKI